MFWSINSDLYLIEKITLSLGMLPVGYNPIKSCNSNTLGDKTQKLKVGEYTFSSQLGSTLKGKEFRSLKASSFLVKSTGVVPIVEGFYYQG